MLTGRVILGLALLVTAGCQSYPPPYGYGYQGNFPVPQGSTYVPQGTTYAPQGTIMAPSTQPAGSGATWQAPRGANPNAGQAPATTSQGATGGKKAVPNYGDAGGAPATLGTSIDAGAGDLTNP